MMSAMVTYKVEKSDWLEIANAAAERMKKDSVK